jgi:hypothetical protein
MKNVILLTVSLTVLLSVFGMNPVRAFFASAFGSIALIHFIWAGLEYTVYSQPETAWLQYLIGGLTCSGLAVFTLAI